MARRALEARRMWLLVITAVALTYLGLCLLGTRDEVIPVDIGQTLGRLFPHATVHLVEGATHNDVFYAPGVLEELVRFARAGGELR